MANRSGIPVSLALLFLPCSSVLAAPPRDALHEESRMELTETPLAQMAAYLSDLHGVKFVLAPSVEGTEGISVNARGRLADLLTKILGPLNLEYRIHQDTILIAPTDKALYLKRLRDKAEAERLAHALEHRAQETLKALDARFVEDGRGWVSQARLSGGNVSDSQIAPLRDLRRLTRLDLSGTAITAEGLAQLKGLDRLTILKLRGTRISDNGLQHLQALVALRVLDISTTRITDDGLLTLADVPRLDIIFVADTPTTANGIAKLREKLPGVRIYTEIPKPAEAQPAGLNQEGASDPFDESPGDPFGGKRR